MRHDIDRILYEERRAIHDFYATPSNITEALLRVEDFPGTVWEPAAGEGHISKVLKAHGLDVVSTDLIDRGYRDAQSGVDFLDTEIECDHVVTNPPYVDDLHLYFAAHALHVANKKVALLLSTTFLESTRNCRFLDRSPLKVIYRFTYPVFTLRQGFVGKPSKRKAFCWFVWQRGWRKEPVIRWLKKNNT